MDEPFFRILSLSSLWLRMARVTCLTRGVLATVVFVGSLGIPHFLQFEGAQFQFNPETSENWIFAKMQNGIKKKRKSFECVLFALWLSAFSRKIWTDYNRDKQTNEQKNRYTQSNLIHKSRIGEFWHIKTIQCIWKLTFFKKNIPGINFSYLSIWIDSKPIVWDSSVVFTDNSD